MDNSYTLDASALYKLAAEKEKLVQHQEALMLYQQSQAQRPHPVTALRIAQQLFAMGRFSEIEYPERELWTDGWIRIGILASALQNDEPALQGWLAHSKKVRESKFIKAFLEVIYHDDKPLSQRARLVAPVLVAKEYAGLLRL